MTKKPSDFLNSLVCRSQKVNKMAKKSMIAKAKREPKFKEHTPDAKFADDLMRFTKILVSAEFAFARWQMKVLFQASKKQAGKEIDYD